MFGQRLEETVLYERRYGVHMAPLVVEQCVDFIRERGLLEVGLFRQPGQATLVKELQDAFDAGEKPSFDRLELSSRHKQVLFDCKHCSSQANRSSSWSYTYAPGMSGCLTICSCSPTYTGSDVLYFKCVCMCVCVCHPSSTDVHTVASLLKLYLRELPEPLVPFSRYQDFLVCGKKISSERKQVSVHPAASCRPCWDASDKQMKTEHNRWSKSPREISNW